MTCTHLPPKHSASRGFTAIELIAVVAILGILAALAAPSFREFITRSRMDSAANELTNAVAFARSEAIRTRSNVVIAKDANKCRTTTTTQDWSCGFVVFRDANKNNRQDNNEAILRQTDELSGLNLMHVSATPTYISFGAFGIAPSAPGRFVYTPESSGLSMSITLCMTSGGRIRKLDGDASCPS